MRRENNEMVNYQLIRKKLKTLCIKVNSVGEVFVYAPITMSIVKINEFLDKKEKWILQRATERLSDSRDISQYRNLEVLRFFGNDYKIILSQRVQKPLVEQDCFYIFDRNQEKIKKFLQQNTRYYLLEKLNFFANLIGVSYNSFKISSAKTRWGSCSAKKVLSFNYCLCMLDTNLFDYVIIHELCHLKNMNHSKSFWQEVALYCKNYRAIRKEMKKFAYYTEIY